MTILSLSVSPQKPHYSSVWYDTVLSVIRTYSSKFICAEESGSNDAPTHVQAALEVDDDQHQALNRALLRAIQDLPGRGPTTKVMKKNPNAFKYVCKEDGRKVYEGFEDAEILELRAQYLEEIALIGNGGNQPFYILSKKILTAIFYEYEDFEGFWKQPRSHIFACLMADGQITMKEYNRAKNNLPVMTINMQRMKKKWDDAVQAIRDEESRVQVEQEITRHQTVFKSTEDWLSQRKENPDSVTKWTKVYDSKGRVMSWNTGEQIVLKSTQLVRRSPSVIENAVALRADELDFEAIIS